MAQCTNKTFLYYKTGTESSGTFSKLIDITEYPDLLAPREFLDATTLSNDKYQYILGIHGSSEMTFNAWYEKEAFETIVGLENTMCTFQVWFGEDGKDGKFEWIGRCSASVSGAGVNAVRPMAITISDEGSEGVHLVTA